MKKILLLSCVFVLTCMQLMAGNVTKGLAFGDPGYATLASGNSIELKDAEYIEQEGASGSICSSVFVKKNKSRVIFSFAPGQCQLPAFTASVNVRIRIFYGTGTSDYTGEDKTLEVKYDPSDPYSARAVVEYTNLNCLTKIYVQVLASISKPSSVDASSFTLKAENEKESYRAVTSPYTVDPVPAHPYHAYQSAENELKVSWEPKIWAESYDLEWLYVNDYDDGAAPPSDIATYQDKVMIDARAFQFNSTRINTRHCSYRIPIIYDHGYIIYRIRAVGRSADDNYTTDVPQEWTVEEPLSASLPAIKLTDFPDDFKYFIGTPQDINLNWQTSNTFAEEGKHKTVTRYFDGSLRNRQEVSRLSTFYSPGLKPTIIGETVYDFEGRPAVKIMPVPSTNQKIAFTPGFNRSDADDTKAYSKADFDNDPVPCGLDAGPIKSTTGAADYYSSDNDFKALSGAPRHHSLIPDAEQYPIIQTRYTRDNTGRVSAQSAPGKDFQLGSGYETKYMYGHPGQLELNRLFGSDAGYAKHYKKTMTQDPNGQLSISYTDMQDKVVATSIIGPAPTTMDGVSTNKTDPSPMNEDMLGKTRPTDRSGVNNELDLQARTRSVKYDMVIGDREIRNFYYKVINESYEPGCLDASYGSLPPGPPSGTLSGTSFDSRIDYAVQGAPLAFAAGDMDQDGFEDIVSICNTGDKLSVLLNKLSEGTIGSSSFTELLFDGIANMKKVAIADVDHDNKNDILVLAGSSSNKLYVYKNTGDGLEVKFSQQAEVSVGAGAGSFATGDLNFDGLPDVVVSNNGASTLSLLIGTVLPHGAMAVNFTVSTQSLSFAPGCVKVEDIDGDLKTDIIVADPSGKKVYVLLNTSSSPSSVSFASPVSWSVSETVKEIFLADVDGDNKSDIIVTHYGSSHNISVLQNTSTAGTAAFTAAATITYGSADEPFFIWVSDLNRDHHADIAVVNVASGSRSVRIFQENNSSPGINFLTGFNVLSGISASDFKGVIVLDADHDGRKDLLTLDNGNSRVSFLHNIITGLPPCYECVLDLDIRFKANDQCKIDYLSELEEGHPGTMHTTIGPLDEVTATPDFFPMYNCPETPAVFTRGKDNSGTGNLWKTNTYEDEASVDAILEAGSYTLTKVLTVNQKALDIYTDNYVNNNACLKSYNAFLNEEVALIDFSRCDASCEERLAWLGDKNYDHSSFNESVNPDCKPCMTKDEFDELVAAVEASCESSSTETGCENAMRMLEGDMSPRGQYGQLDNTKVDKDGKVPTPKTGAEITPGDFPLSVFNVDNQLPQKLHHFNDYSAFYQATFPDFPYGPNYRLNWAPNWRYPFNQPRFTGTIGTEDVYSYLDKKGNIDYVELIEVGHDEYSPAVHPDCKAFVITDNITGKKKIKPQYLNDVKDFIMRWKPSWAQALVAYHPEYGYWAECVERQVSNRWDRDWYSLDHAVNIPRVDENGDPIDPLHGSNDVYPGWAATDLSTYSLTTAVETLIGTLSGSTVTGGLDPYFSTLSAAGKLLPGEYTSMKDRLLNYGSDLSQPLSIWDLAYRMVHCPSQVQGCSVCNYVQLGTSSDADVANQEWRTFQSLYQSLKQEVIKSHDTRVAIKKQYYNGCICEKPFNAFQDNFIFYSYVPPTPLYNLFPWYSYSLISKITYTGSWTTYLALFPFTAQLLAMQPLTQFLHPEQPCNAYRYGVYKGKRARFPRIEQMIGAESMNAHKCPDDADLDKMNLVNCAARNTAISDELRKVADTKISNECRECPLAQQFEGLLNAMLQRGDLDASGSVPLFSCSSDPTTKPGLTDELMMAIAKQATIATDIDYINFTHSSTVNSGTEMLEYTGTFSYSVSSTPNECSFTINIPYSSTNAYAQYSVADINRFCCITSGTMEEDGTYAFLVNATFYTKPDDPEYTGPYTAISGERQTKIIKLSGYSTCMDLVNCGVSNLCSTTPVSTSLMNLFNGLCYNQPLINTTGVGSLPAASPAFLPALPYTTTSTVATFITLNDRENLSLWTPMFTWDIQSRLKLGEAHEDYKIYWTSIYTNTAHTAMKGYFYNSTRPLLTTGGSPYVLQWGSTYTYSDLDNIGACAVDIELLSSSYTLQDVLAFTDITGEGNNFTAKAMVYNSTSNQYEYIDVTGHSPCFVFGQCGTGTLPRAFEGGLGSEDPESTEPVPARKKDVVIEVNASESDCSIYWSTDRFRALAEVMISAIKSWTENGTGDTHFPLGTYYFYGAHFAHIGTAPPHGGCTDCAYELISAPPVDLSQITHVEGISRVYGSENEFILYVKLRGSDEIVEVKGRMGYGAGPDPYTKDHYDPPTGFTLATSTTSDCAFPLRPFPEPDPPVEDVSAKCNTCGNLLFAQDASYKFARYYNDINYEDPDADELVFQENPGAFTRQYGEGTRVFDTELIGDYGMRLFRESEYTTPSDPHYIDEILREGKYAILKWGSNVGCNPLYEMVFRMSPSSSAYTMVWKAPAFPVTHDKKYRFSFVLRRISPVMSTDPFFRVKVKIGGTSVAFRKYKFDALTYQYEVDWTAGHLATNADLEIDVQNTDPSNTNTYALSSLMFEEDCKPVECCPATPPDITVQSPCRRALMLMAEVNAQMRYDEYIRNVKDKFREGYIKKCLDVYEDFYMRSNSTEDHFTLYYYDQAGNLVRTIPPKGVHPLDTDPGNLTDKAKLEQVNIDREQGVKTVFMPHTMATTYKYNSLNQLQYQSMPDHKDMNIFKTDRLAGISAGETVNQLDFFTASEGVAVTEDGSGDGHIYKTGTAGKSWTEISAFGIPDLNDLKIGTYSRNGTYTSREVTVGKNGTVMEIELAPALSDWALKPVPTSGELVRAVIIASDDVYDPLTSVLLTPGTGALWVYEKSGACWYKTLDDPDATWNGPLNDLKFKLTGSLKDLYFMRYDATNPGQEKVGYAVSDDGKVYMTSNSGAIWHELTGNGEYLAPDYGIYTTFFNGTTGFIGGDNGLLLKSTLAVNTPATPVAWKVVPNNLTTRIRKIHFTDVFKGIVLVDNTGTGVTDLQYTADGAATFTPVLTNVKDMHFLTSSQGYALRNDAGTYKLYKTTDGGNVWTYLCTVPSFGSDLPLTLFSCRYIGSDPYLLLGGQNKKLFLSADEGQNWGSVSVSGSGISSQSIVQIHAKADDFTSTMPVNIRLSDGRLYNAADISGMAPTWTAPSVGGTDVVSLSFYDADNGFAVSSDYSTYKTSDAGITWSAAPMTAVPFSSGTLTTACFISMSKGIMINSLGEIAVTHTADKTLGTWDPQEHLISHPRLSSIEASSNYLHAAGEDGTWMVMRTDALPADNDYKKWYLLKSNTSAAITDLAFDGYASSNSLFAVTASGDLLNMYISNVTGYSFASYHVSSNRLNRICAAGSQFYICGNSKTILGGSIGAVTTYTVPGPAVTLNAITSDFSSRTDAAGQLSSMFTKVSSTWTYGSGLGASALKAVHMVTSQVGYAVGNSGNIWKTGNGGSSWQLINTIPSAAAGVNFHSVRFTDANKGTVVGGTSSGHAAWILYTADGGLTWSDKSISGITADLNQVRWLNSQSGIIVGNSRTVLWTSTAGSSWTALTGATVTSGCNLYATSFPDATRCFIAGSGGEMMKLDLGTMLFSSIVCSGCTVSLPYVVPSEDVFDLYFKDQLIGYAAGDNHTFLKTVDGGYTWEQKTMPTSLTPSRPAYDIRTLAVLDEHNFLAGGSADASLTGIFDFSNEYSTRFFYDKLGRMSVSQNSKQYAQYIGDAGHRHRYSYTLYDFKGRITEVGEIDATSEIETVYDGTGQMDDDLFNSWMYANRTGRHEITRTFYDAAALSGNLPGDFDQDNLRNRVASTTIAAAYNSDLTVYEHGMHYSYDIHGNVKELMIENTRMPSFATTGVSNQELRYKRISYTYDLISGKVNTVSYQPGKPDQFYHKYEYDADNRITDVKTSYDHVVWESDARYTYYLHGPLARTELGEDNVQGMDYAYTIQGWLKAVNSATLEDADTDIGQDGKASGVHERFAMDEIGFMLGYYANDFKPIGISSGPGSPIIATASSTLNSGNSLHNGNISHMVTAIRKLMAGEANFHPTGTSYQYDQLNRIITASYDTDVDHSTNAWGTGTAPDDYYNHFEYDANGNIKKQTRYAQNGLHMDELDYDYNTGSNQLNHVTDAVSADKYADDVDNQRANNYGYDLIGNLAQDSSEQIDTITWTVYGKIASIIREAGSPKPDIYFEYGPDGNRVMKKVVPKAPGSRPSYTYYVRDAQGNIMATYERIYEKAINYGSLTYADVNNEIITLRGAETFGNMIGTLSGGDGGMLSALYTYTTGLSPTEQRDILYHFDPVLTGITGDGSLFNAAMLHYDAFDYLSGYFDKEELNMTDFLNSFCSCTNAQLGDDGLFRHLMRNAAARNLFFRALMAYDHSQFITLVTNVIGTYDMDDEVNMANIMSYGVEDEMMRSETEQAWYDAFNAQGSLSCEFISAVLKSMYDNDHEDLYHLLATLPNLQKKVEAQALCTCGLENTQSIVEWLAALSGSRREYLVRALYHYNPSLAYDIINYLGHSSADENDAVDFMMNTYSGTDADIADALEAHGITECNEQLMKLIEVMNSLVPPSVYANIFDKFPERTGILANPACISGDDKDKVFKCLLDFADVFGSDGAGLYAWNPHAVWDALLAVGSANDFLSVVSNYDPQAFITLVARLYPDAVSSYQQANNPYGSMENYFNDIKAISPYGPDLYADLVAYFSSISNTQVDKLSIATWDLYGSSRLGAMNAGTNLSSVKFDATYSAGTFGTVSSASASYTSAPTGNFLVSRGNKRYELSNHLGNVLAVVTDRRTPQCAETVLYSENFEHGSTGAFTAASTATFSNVGGRIEVQLPSSGAFSGIETSITGYNTSKTYVLSFDLDVGPDALPSGGQINVSGTWNLASTGHYELTFSGASTALANLRFRSVNNSSNNLTRFYVDNIKIREQTLGAINRYSAEVMQATDYSPFGAPLPGRTWDRSKENTRHIVMSNQFDFKTTEGWTGSGATILTDNGRLKISRTTSGFWANIIRTIPVKVGRTYRVTFNIDMNNCNRISMPVYNAAITSLVSPYLIVYKTGNYTYEFTATEDNMKLIFEMNTADNPSAGIYYLDNIVLEEITKVKNAYMFGFNGKEKDNETYGDGNEYDYGDRIYSPRLGRWMSIDKLASKYPQLTPYHFSNNNSIIYKDVDGKDYILTVDHKTKTITVTANYYVAEGNAADKAAATHGTQKWNDASGKFTYVSGYGQTAQNYTVNFDLNVIETKDPVAAAKNDIAGNTFQVNNTIVDNEDKRANGVTKGGKDIYVRTQRGDNTDEHEVGHTLGLDHFFSGFMTEGGTLLKPLDPTVLKGYVQEILDDQDIGSKPGILDGEENRNGPPVAKGTTKEANSNKKPSDFKNGEVVETKFLKKPAKK